MTRGRPLPKFSAHNFSSRCSLRPSRSSRDCAPSDEFATPSAAATANTIRTAGSAFQEAEHPGTLLASAINAPLWIQPALSGKMPPDSQIIQSAKPALPADHLNLRILAHGVVCLQMLALNLQVHLLANGGATVADQFGVRMSGGLATQNGLLTGGGESRNVMRTDQAFTVPLESVAEFRIDTATYSAEYGRSGGGVVNIVTSPAPTPIKASDTSFSDKNMGLRNVAQPRLGKPRFF